MADLNRQDNNGNAALHLALENDHLDLARQLIEKGADDVAETSTGRDARDLSTAKNLREVMALQAKPRLLGFAMAFHENLGAQSRVRQLLCTSNKEMTEMILKNTSEHREPGLLPGAALGSTSRALTILPLAETRHTSSAPYAAAPRIPPPPPPPVPAPALLHAARDQQAVASAHHHLLAAQPRPHSLPGAPGRQGPRPRRCGWEGARAAGGRRGRGGGRRAGGRRPGPRRDSRAPPRGRPAAPLPPACPAHPRPRPRPRCRRRPPRGGAPRRARCGPSTARCPRSAPRAYRLSAAAARARGCDGTWGAGRGAGRGIAGHRGVARGVGRTRRPPTRRRPVSRRRARCAAYPRLSPSRNTTSNGS
jgi:hypothetical protein